MAKYAVFSHDGKQSGCGTDSYLPLDQRFNVINQTAIARNHAKMLNECLNKGYTHFGFTNRVTVNPSHWIPI